MTIVSAAILIVLALSPTAAAEGLLDAWLPTERPILDAGKEVAGDYFAFGPRVAISGTVHGDLYAAGGEVMVDGVVEGDLIAAGGTVVLSGTVAQNARVAGGLITLSGTIGRNATMAGGDVELTGQAAVKGNWLAAGGHVRAAGSIGGDARIAAGEMILSDSIGGHVTAAAPSIRLTSTAAIGKNLRYWSEEEPSLEEGATIRGTMVRRPLPETLKAERFHAGLTALKLAGLAVSFCSTLILGLILVRSYPVFSLAVDWTIRERPLASLGMGLAAVVGVPILVLACIVTVLAVPIGLVLAALYAASLYLARIFVMAWAGQLVLLLISDRPSPTWAFVTGLLLYSIIMLVPVVGSVITVVTILLGVGASLLTKRALVDRLREEKLV
ncbi:MAG TPA: polymer-forming cytoskeletal protein [Nitrospira sp.]|nr:polymer-forming cytoskeletal protein [Nitrospira sp.]